MVDALRRAHRMLRPGGLFVDVHPTASNAVVEVVGGAVVGRVHSFDGPARHAAADAALDAAVAERLLTIERTVEFDFLTYGDTIDELRDYVAEEWVHARIDDDVVEGARRAVASAAGAGVRLRERVKAARYARR
jgi:hypothetical protein